MAEMKDSWQRACGDSGQPEPSEAKLITMAKEALAAEAAAEKTKLALEAELAASEAEAVKYWNSMAAVREAKAAAMKAAEMDR